MTFVTGGQPPYRYTITNREKVSEVKLATEGWIAESLKETPEPGKKITIQITDSRNEEVSKSLTNPYSTVSAGF